MQIDVNSTADRAHLMRAQLTSTRSAPLDPKTPIIIDGGALTDKSALTDFASAPAMKNISDVRVNPPVTGTIPTPEPTTRPATDFGSVTQTEANSLAVTDQRPAEPANRIDALLADWGQSDSPYDLDGNGTVGSADLLILLARLSEGSQEPEPPQLQGDVAGPAPQSAQAMAEPQLSEQTDPNRPPTNRLDALLADWGQSDSPFDLDGNGIVGANDLLMLLARLSEPSVQPNTPVNHAPAITSGDPATIGVNAATIAPQIIDDLEQNDSGAIAPPEVDGSAPTIDRVDQQHYDNRNETPGEQNPAAQRSSQAYQRMNLEEIARKLMLRLTDYGPSDLANFVQAGKLSAIDTKIVLDRISMLNPSMLGVNEIG